MRDIVVLSGGIDSAVTLAVAREQLCIEDREESILALGYYYGQSHARELDHAEKVARDADVPFFRDTLLGLHGSVLLEEGEAPAAHYDDPAQAVTVVPGRNLLFAAHAVAVADPGDRVWFGVHAGDRHTYPDCRPAFWHDLAGIVLDTYGVELLTPLLEQTKAQLIARGDRLGVPFDLTYTCYRGAADHCGVCGSCTERREAFILAGVTDPTRYAAVAV